MSEKITAEKPVNITDAEPANNTNVNLLVKVPTADDFTKQPDGSWKLSVTFAEATGLTKQEVAKFKAQVNQYQVAVTEAAVKKSIEQYKESSLGMHTYHFPHWAGGDTKVTTFDTKTVRNPQTGVETQRPAFTTHAKDKSLEISDAKTKELISMMQEALGGAGKEKTA